MASLRHGNSFPLINQAILDAADCIGRRSPVKTDLTILKSISVNATFVIPEKAARKTYFPARMIGGFIGCLEICALTGLGTFLGLRRTCTSSALAGCLASTSLCYVILQRLGLPVYVTKMPLRRICVLRRRTERQQIFMWLCRIGTFTKWMFWLGIPPSYIL